MKDTAYLINTARGAIINEDGLYKAIKEKKIAGAAIDVFDVEPNTNSVLKELPEVILTPHVGTFTQEIFIKMDILAAKNIVKKFKL
jgi:D-3-phosphoglycerate dehydrogenase